MVKRSFAIEAADPIQALRGVMQRLRDPLKGCPWDVKQSFATIAAFTVEEAYEVAEAISRNDLLDLQEELGDLLLQVVFHAQIAEEAAQFNFDDVARGIVDKMVRRHPHVFAGHRYENEAEQSRAWSAIKQHERVLKDAKRAQINQGTQAASVSKRALSSRSFSEIGRGLPEFQRALKLQAKAAEFGFDWPQLAPVFAKLREEVDELEVAAASGDRDHCAEELGDVLFVAVNLARHLRVDPAQSLTGCNTKFEQRFARMEVLAALLEDAADKSRESGTADASSESGTADKSAVSPESGSPLSRLGLEAQDTLWDQAKVLEKAQNTGAVTLFYRPACHLCTEAQEICAALGLTPEQVDIDQSAELGAAYGLRIPVLRIGAIELDWPLAFSKLTESCY